MREAQLRREMAIRNGDQIFYIAVIGIVLVMAIMYFLTQYVVRSANARPASYPASSAPPADSNGGAILITPNSEVSAGTVYFS